jgi:hypothetical protein
MHTVLLEVIVSYNFQEEIKEYVKNVCSLLPRTVGNPCRQFIEEYGDIVIALLAQSLDPKQVCAEIKVCSGSKLKHSVLLGKYCVLDEDSLCSCQNFVRLHSCYRPSSAYLCKHSCNAT